MIFQITYTHKDILYPDLHHLRVQSQEYNTAQINAIAMNQCVMRRGTLISFPI
jgi:hypothetical protein